MNEQASWLLKNDYAQSYDELVTLAIQQMYEAASSGTPRKRPRKLRWSDRRGVEMWIDACCTLIDTPSAMMKDLHPSYMAFAQNNRYPFPFPLTRQGLGRHLSQMVDTHRRSEGRYYALRVDSQQEVMDAVITGVDADWGALDAEVTNVVQ